MSVIAFFCNNLYQLHFFLRLSPRIKDRGVDIVFLSNRLSVVLAARRYGEVAVLFQGYSQRGTGSIAADRERTFEVCKGILSAEQAQRCAKRSEAAALYFFKKYRPNQLWLWNGSNIVRQTLVDVGRRLGIKSLFFEFGNFPGKIFVDTEGVNCRSWYARHRDEMKKVPVDLDSFRTWKLSYVESKIQQHFVPQANFASRFNFSFALDLAGFWLFGGISPEPARPLWRTIDFLRRRFSRITFDLFNPKENPGYLFFPLQVSTDSQILWNSDISQVEALQCAADISKKEGKDLIVKLHPAEPHWSAISDVLHKRKILGFKLVTGNTFDLLQYCSRVVTINSTVGLEALIIGKPVKILGKSHYEGFDEKEIAIYIQKYLIDIDFFSNQILSDDQLEAIFSRASNALA